MGWQRDGHDWATFTSRTINVIWQITLPYVVVEPQFASPILPYLVGTVLTKYPWSSDGSETLHPWSCLSYLQNMFQVHHVFLPFSLLSLSEHTPLFAWNAAVASTLVSLLLLLLPLPSTFHSLLKCYSESLKTKFRSCPFPAKTSNSFPLYAECSSRSWTCSGSSYMTQHLFISINHPIPLSLDH